METGSTHPESPIMGQRSEDSAQRIDSWREDMADLKPINRQSDEIEIAWWERPSPLESLHRDPRPMNFRVIDTHGECPKGIRMGDMISVTGTWREVTPHLCPYAESVLRVAAMEDEVAGIGEWCCPVYDHLLVFRREISTA